MLKNDDNNELWKLFHLNSICTPYDCSDDEPDLTEFRSSDKIDYLNFPAILLPTSRHSLDIKLADALHCRKSSYKMQPASITLEDISTLFTFSCLSPSAGAKYPIEIYFHYSGSLSRQGQALLPGLYYYSPRKNELRLLNDRNCQQQLQTAFIQQEIVSCSIMQIFITAMFPRTTKKYGNRGYRFAFLEAGHIAQNFNLVATAMNLLSLNIGGYYEKALNHFLKIDGINHSVIYPILIGK